MPYFDKPASHDRLLCVDIETVPDRSLYPDLPKDKFPPKVIMHRVVAISFVEATLERYSNGAERYIVNCCRTGGQAGWDEKQILDGYWRYFGDSQTRIVTWNGRGFDLPVLRARAMIHGLSAERWYMGGSKWEGYTQRYAPDWHCDLMEQLSDYRSCSNMSQDDLALAIGLPGKIGGHGSEVEGMVERGEIDKVRAYCEGDVLNLFGLYVRWALLTGRTDPEGHNASLESLVECLERERGDRPHLGEFLDRWRATDRPAPMFVPSLGSVSAAQAAV